MQMYKHYFECYASTDQTFYDAVLKKLFEEVMNSDEPVRCTDQINAGLRIPCGCCRSYQCCHGVRVMPCPCRHRRLRKEARTAE
eukprot:COSAG01_NODE_17256_length_1166_cov_1.258669_2_plen_84_part_00